MIDATPAEAPIDFAPEALASLDGVSLRDMFDTRAVVVHSVPFFLRGAFRGALKVSLQAIIRGHEQHSDLRITRVGSSSCYSSFVVVWRGGKVPKKTLEERFHMFREGRWLELLALSRGIEGRCPSVIYQPPPSAEAG